MITYHLFGFGRLDLSESKYAGVSELADEADSKSVDGNIVWVQVPSPAVINSSSVSAEEFFVVKKILLNLYFFFIFFDK